MNDCLTSRPVAGRLWMPSSFISLQRRHWLLISILMGYVAVTFARPGSLNLQTEYGEARNSQREFENSLMREIEGRRQFKGIVVHRQSVPNPAGGERTAWIVSGLYCSGAPDVADGKLHWKPAFFVANQPYRPATDPRFNRGGATSETLGESQPIANPTVLDYLQSLSETQAVHYSHAWWRTYATLLWLGGCVVGIGFVWPTLIDLIVFGRWIRPREEKAVALKPSPMDEKTAKAAMSLDDRAKLEALDATMEARLRAGVTSKASTVIATAGVAAIRALHGDSSSALPPAAKAARAFGAGAGDFYPTEQKAKSVGKPGS